MFRLVIRAIVVGGVGLLIAGCEVNTPAPVVQTPPPAPSTVYVQPSSPPPASTVVVRPPS